MYHTFNHDITQSFKIAHDFHTARIVQNGSLNVCENLAKEKGFGGVTCSQGLGIYDSEAIGSTRDKNSQGMAFQIVWPYTLSRGVKEG